MTDPRKTPWVVLGLDPAWFPELLAPGAASSSSSSTADTATRTAFVRRAYRRALLQHHPDKQQREAAGGEAAEGARGGASAAGFFTVDDIKAAYAAALGGGGSSGSRAAAHPGDTGVPSSLPTATAATGLEVVDLDELPYDEPAQTWYRACRCGNPRGFTFGERDLEEELDAEALETLVGGEDGEDGADGAARRPKPIAAGELLVGCQDCSLWLCVHFAAAPDGATDDDDDDDDGSDDGDHR